MIANARFLTAFLAACLVAAPACIIEKTVEDDGSGDDGDGGGGQGGDGPGTTTSTGTSSGSTQIAEGPPGSVGNDCNDDGTCDPDLVCAASSKCQPAFTELPYNIVQAVPTPDSGEIPASTPILLFADGTYQNVTFAVQAFTIDGSFDITGEVTSTKLTSGANKDVFVLSAKKGYPLGASVVVTITGDIQGTLVFNVAHEAPDFADGALGFEAASAAGETCNFGGGSFTALPVGWTGFGDVGVIPATGSMSPTEGSKLAALSSGSAICGSALSETSSLLVSGPLHAEGKTNVLFDYFFQSSEFDDYCNSSYDDTLLAVLAGPEGAVSKVVTSVNITCGEGSHGGATFPGMPDGGDTVYKGKGPQTFTLSGNVGSPAVVAFIVTDVGDGILSSVAAIDNIRFQ